MIYIEYHSEADRREIDQLLADRFYLVRSIVARGNLGTQVYVAKDLAEQTKHMVAAPLVVTSD